ncbi:MAG: hypothetical protein J1F12_01160 [Muribaculaceae bacterium]|nr:hypothetical protein [Muribaculaceae bacterium]
MSKQKFSLSYLNEDDRAYGLAGMMIALANLDAIDRVANVTIDTDGPMVEFSHAYYFSGSPSISPKSTWDNLVANFHITTSMVVGNVLARSLVRLKEEAPKDIMKEIYDIVLEEGQETCALEDDEIERLYDHAMARALRVFRNPRMHSAIDEFARIISLKRSFSGREIFDELHLLQLI